MLLQEGLASNTRKKYNNKIHYFKKFSEIYNINLLQIKKNDIYWYVCWRFQSDPICTYGTVKSEINSIQSWLVDNKIELSVLSWKPLVRLLNGFKKLRPSKTNIKNPLSTNDFSILLDQLPSVSHDTQLLRAALCWEQNGFARSAEYTIKSNNNISENDLKNAVSLNNLKFDVNIDGSHCMIYTQYKSKTNQFRSKETKVFSCRCPGPCAIKEVKQLLKFRKRNCTSDFLFRFANGKFLTYNNVNNTIKNLCVKAGFDPNLFGTHSLRKGAAVDAINEGLDLVQVMRAGNWKSINGFKNYPILSDTELCQLRRNKFQSNQHDA